MMEELLKGTGAVAIIAALSAWLSKVWANRILQKDRIKYETQMNTLLEGLRTQSGKALFVHRLQFEKEFEVYLGLWKDARQRLFAGTSLSAKLTTYAASACPVIVDAPSDSVAWGLVSRHGAGIRLGADPDANQRELSDLMSSPARWHRHAAGAEALCSAAFDLEKNMLKFTSLLARAGYGDSASS